MPFVDPGDDRHQFYRADMQFAEMRQDRRVRQRSHRAAHGLGNVGMQQREGTDVDFVNQPSAFKNRGLCCQRLLRLRHDRARHDGGSIRTEARQCPVLHKASIQLARIRIDQQLGRIEP